MKSGNRVELKQAIKIIETFSTAILRDDSSCRTALCRIGDKFVRISIVYEQKAVVFSETKTKEQIIKFYN